MGANFDFHIRKHYAFHFSCVAKILQNPVRGSVAGPAGPANKTNDPLKSGPANDTNDPLKSGPDLHSQTASTLTCLLTTHAYTTCSC